MWGRARESMVILLVCACALLLALLPGTAPVPLLAPSEACASPGTGWVKQDVVCADCMFFDITAVDQNTVWCVGSNFATSGSLVMKTTDGGAHWQRQETGTSKSLFAIDAVDERTAWTVGNGIILKTTDGGSTWVSQGSVSNIYLLGISAVSDQVAWAAGLEGETPSSFTYHGVVLRTTDGGSTWKCVKTGAGASECYYDVDAVDKDKAWVSATGGALKTTDGGGSWSFHNIAAGGQFRKISSLGDGKVWVLGNVMSTGKALSVYVSGDGGGSWSGYHFPIGYTPMITAGISVVDGNNAWVAAMPNETAGMFNIEGYVFRTTDGGASWGRLQPCGDVIPTAVCTAGADTAWVAGMGSIARTTDGGATWTSQLPARYDFHAVDARAGSGVMAVASGGMQVTYAHLFNPALPENLWLGGPVDASGQVDEDLLGVTVEQDWYWAVGVDGTVIKAPTPASTGAMANQSLGITNDIHAVSSAGADTVWIAGENGIMKTTNGGDTWTPQVVIPQTVYAICAVDTQTVWAAGQGGLLGKTTNGGATWVTQDSGTTADLHGIAAVNAQTAWAVGAGGTILKTTNGGATWVPQTSGTTADLHGIAAVNAQTAWAVGAGGTILKTTNGGATWVPQTSGTTVTLRGVAALDALNAFAVGDDGTILRTEDGGGTGVELSVTAVAPNQATQLTYRINLTVSGTGFEPGAKVRLEKGSTVIKAFNAKVVSDTQITCSADILGASPGAYDVVVANPGGGEARLEKGFTVTSPCGTGGGTAVLMLGLSLGLLSLAGCARRRGRRRRA
ncbi:MAG: hypothetical protein H5T73_06055 [Actinobacteria bacterium]|nr:hypothetical protein [Actinomycetota bacterium]